MSQSRILIVDDEPQVRRTLRATLSDLGYSVLEARNGEEALDLLTTESVELILLDLNMPGMGGLEACRAIREHHETPVIVLSVRNTEADKVRVLDAGADDYVTKPFGIQELMARG
jgi:two-component system KDP operon response regulator KdpE